MTRETLTNESVQEAQALIQQASQAQATLKTFSQKQIDTIVKSMADAALRESIRLAQMAADETGFGNAADKVVKNEFASKKLYEHIKDQKTIGVLKTDPVTRTMDVAVPMGVVAALIPSTNPTSTTIYKTMIALKSGNGIVISPHPSAIKSITETVRIVYEAALAAGAPEGIIGCMSKLSLEGTQALMTSHDTAMILATGGEAMVRAAYSSGNPAIGVGPGNSPAYIEKSANVTKAVEKIFLSKTFDNGVICASEQSIVVEKSMEERVRNEIVKNGGYFLSEEESAQLGKFILRENGTMNPQIVGKTAQYVAELAGLTVPDDTRILLSEQNTVSKTNPYSREKLTPILAFYVEQDNAAALQRCADLLVNEGSGHTASIHSNNISVINEFSLRMPVSRCLVNTPSALGGIGATTDLTPALTLGCGAVGGSSVSDNVGPEHLFNIKKVVYHFEEQLENVA
ncbi:acetaldehyde dehydrogenase (acetylating) [Vibrio porteresiae]|uniref:Acetaldehyde dehydrogenase (Acetylating) n=1 Tax=Vibrio porteresiae DSM 19223 TaxID=1123496 RepID=A0ABZ0QDX6_9VIBR|nr:acetaldehyde dehydrogenase (acetylating) [Vibrio porteresiae]WPC74653.1 acetaldehyde dehydrogenase (acetylating) [Vibrio porteresiae DSM 19223]